jgi:hypothetical protein
VAVFECKIAWNPGGVWFWSHHTGPTHPEFAPRLSVAVETHRVACGAPRKTRVAVGSDGFAVLRVHSDRRI